MKKGNFKIYSSYEHYLPGASGVIILLVWFIVGALLGNVFSLLLGLTGMGMDAILPVSYVVMFIPPMLYSATKSRSIAPVASGRKLDSSNFKPVGGIKCAGIVIVGTLALGVIADGLTALLPEMPETLKALLESMTGGNFWINFLCVSIFAPFFEEWLCRGMILRGLLGRGSKPWVAIVISALVFAVIHANPWQAVPAFLLGAFFGYVYYKTGSLKLTMLMHFTNNTFALICGHTDSLKDVETMMDLFGRAYPYALAASILIVLLSILAFKKIELNSKSGNMDEVKPLFSE